MENGKTIWGDLLKMESASGKVGKAIKRRLKVQRSHLGPSLPNWIAGTARDMSNSTRAVNVRQFKRASITLLYDSSRSVPVVVVYAMRMTSYLKLLIV